MAESTFVIQVKDLTKSYGKTSVLKGIDLEVKRGTMLALPGSKRRRQNNYGTDFSTLLPYDGGSVKVAGHEVSAEADAVRRVIGLTGQSAAVDELLTGGENLVMMGRLYRLTKTSAQGRAEELLREFDLVDAADRPAKTYSGGMRRRLNLAVSLIATPPIIFLDEPTTGLDPRSRIAMWESIKLLMAAGTTILLTTQYLEEADQLADQIAVIDGGKVIARGTSADLKSKVGKDRLELSFHNEASLAKAVKILGKRVIDSNAKEFSATTVIEDINSDVKSILAELDRATIKLAAMAVHKPTLDDVFLSLTGKQAAAATQEEK